MATADLVPSLSQSRSPMLATEPDRSEEYAAQKHERQRRKLRDRQAAKKAVESKTDIGFFAAIVKAGAGDDLQIDAKRIKKLPLFYGKLVKTLLKIVNCGALFRHINRNYTIIGERRAVKARMCRILVLMLFHCDVLTGRIGIAKPGGYDPITHDSLRLEYARRYGEAIEPSTWYRYIGMLRDAGLLGGEEIKIAGDKDGTVRSKASYKWFTEQFLTMIGAKTDEIRAQAKKTKDKAMAKGLKFDWAVLTRRKSAFMAFKRNNDQQELLLTSPPH